jgi:hypothetical protein
MGRARTSTLRPRLARPDLHPQAATAEKLGELLNHNPNGLLLFRDELGGFLRNWARVSSNSRSASSTFTPWPAISGSPDSRRRPLRAAAHASSGSGTWATATRTRSRACYHHSAGTCGLLTEHTRRQLGRARGERRQHVHAEGPGELFCLDTFYIGKLKGVGKVWQVTACDAACSYMASGHDGLIDPRGRQKRFQVLGKLGLILAREAGRIEAALALQALGTKSRIHHQREGTLHEEVGIILAEAAAEIVEQYATLHVRGRDLHQPRRGEGNHAAPDGRLDLHVGVGLAFQPEEREFVHNAHGHRPTAQAAECAREAEIVMRFVRTISLASTSWTSDVRSGLRVQ